MGRLPRKGIVFYPKYFYWMDSAFQTLLRDAGQSVRAIREGFGIVGIPIVEANAVPRVGDPRRNLRIEAEIRHWGETSCVPSTRHSAATGRSSGVEAASGPQALAGVAQKRLKGAVHPIKKFWIKDNSCSSQSPHTIRTSNCDAMLFTLSFAKL